MDRPEEFRYETGYGVVVQTYDTWHVDIRTVDGGLIERAVVLGHRLPELSSPDRPQWVQYAFGDHAHSQAFCAPVNSRMPGDRVTRRDWVYYDEVQNYRITVNRAGEYEIRNTKDGRLLQVRVREDGGVVELRTPDTRIVLNDDEKSITAECAETLTFRCKTAAVHVEENATVHVGGDLTAEVDGSASITAGGGATLDAPTFDVTADVTITGMVVINGTLEIP